MNIRDLRDGMRRVDVEGIVDFVGEERTVNLRTGGEARTEEIEIKDESGTVKVSLWDDQIDQVVKGAKIHISNGYTNSFRGQLRVQIGKYGRLEVLEAGHGGAVEDVSVWPLSSSTQGTLTGPFSPAQEARIRQIIAEESQR